MTYGIIDENHSETTNELLEVSRFSNVKIKTLNKVERIEIWEEIGREMEEGERREERWEKRGERDKRCVVNFVKPPNVC